MDRLRDFVIPFVGLSVGNHRFEFEVDDSFFEQFEYSELQHGKVTVVADLEKKERMMVLNFHFAGDVEVTCDRCGEQFLYPLAGDEHLIIKFGNEFVEESDEMVTIPSTDYQIDLAPYIYEYLHLALPARLIHPEDAEGRTACDPEILKKLEELSPGNFADPRWEALNRLRQQDDKNGRNQEHK